MIEHPLTVLRREKALIEQQAAWWRRVALVAASTTGLCLIATAGLAYVGHGMAQEMLLYRDNCVKPTTAQRLLEVSQRVSQVNEMCLESHRRHIDVLEEVLPGIFVPDDRVTKWGVLDQDGGGHEPEENVSSVPTSQAIGGVLSRPKP